MHGAPLLARAKLRSFYRHLFDALMPALGLLVVVVEVSTYPSFAPVMEINSIHRSVQ